MFKGVHFQNEKCDCIKYLKLVDPELAIVGTLLHGFEFLFVRLAPFVFISSVIGIIFTYRKR